MHRLAAPLLFTLACALSSPVMAANANEIRDAALSYARSQAQGLPGEITVSAPPVDNVAQLPACAQLQAFTPTGGRLWGKSYVGVRCLAPTPWSILVTVQISALGNYVISARALTAGQALQTTDVTVLQGDLTTLPAGVLTDPSAVAGKTLKNSLAAGQPLRQDLLLAPLLIRQGQTVRLITRGPGFTASGEGKAINNAAEGQIAQVRVPSGQTLSGVVLPDGSVEIGR